MEKVTVLVMLDCIEIGDIGTDVASVREVIIRQVR